MNKSNNSPIVSIIVPVYNAEEFLTECLDSIAAQKMEEFEVLLIDDGSTDNSLSICERYSKIDNRFIVIHQDNQGSSAARNTGLSIASGKYICFVDADDWIESEHLSNILSTAEAETSDVVIIGFYLDGQDVVFFPNSPSAFSSETIIKEGLDRNHHAGVVFTFARRTLYTDNSIRFPRYDYFEDMFVSCSIVHYSHIISYCPTRSYHYRFNPSSLTNNQDGEKRIALFKEFANNLTLLFDKLQLWDNQSLTEALNHRVIYEKTRILQYLDKKEIISTLSDYFPNSYKYYKIEHFPDFFLYLTLRTKRLWPYRFLISLQNFKRVISKS